MLRATHFVSSLVSRDTGSADVASSIRAKWGLWYNRKIPIKIKSKIPGIKSKIPCGTIAARTPCAALLLESTVRLRLGLLVRVRGVRMRVRVQGSGFRVQGSGFRVQGSGLRVQG